MTIKTIYLPDQLNVDVKPNTDFDFSSISHITETLQIPVSGDVKMFLVYMEPEHYELVMETLKSHPNIQDVNRIPVRGNFS